MRVSGVGHLLLLQKGPIVHVGNETIGLYSLARTSHRGRRGQRGEDYGVTPMRTVNWFLYPWTHWFNHEPTGVTTVDPCRLCIRWRVTLWTGIWNQRTG